MAGFMILQKIISLFSALWAVMMANPIVAIVALVVSLVAGIVYLWNHCEAFRNFWINIWENIKMKFAVTVENIKAFFRGLVSFFTGIPGEVKEIGSNMIKGLIDGVNGMKDKAVGAVKNVGKNLLNGMKNVLGIHSPSKEFGIIGKFSVLGYTEALDNMSGEVDKAINSTFGLSPNLTNSASLHYSPNVVVNNNVDISQDPLGQMVSNIKSFSGGAKNDYSFGLGE
jgi:phage-related protein